MKVLKVIGYSLVICLGATAFGSIAYAAAQIFTGNIVSTGSFTY